ncbi:MAG: type II toxin-antitoxin system VapC family toxin [Natronosporangium sp.]
MIYLDTSAAAKLVLPEAESDALAIFLVERIATPLVSSVLLYPELVRAVNRHRPDLAERAIALLQRIMTVPLDHAIVVRSATIGNPLVRTLDALHLATAVTIRSEIDELVTYDKRLAESAAALGLTVAAPV